MRPTLLRSQPRMRLSAIAEVRLADNIGGEHFLLVPSRTRNAQENVNHFTVPQSGSAS
jgi:hypothetical protein